MLTLLGFVVVAARACEAPPSGAAGDVGELNAKGIPSRYVPIFEAAARRYDLGPDGPPILAAIAKIESGFGQNMGPSSAGAQGFMQFMPGTWAMYGVDANGDGRKDPRNPHDAIHAAARYLRASGAPRNWPKAIFAYNHADWYVREVLEQARRFGADGGGGIGEGAKEEPAGGCGEVSSELEIGGVKKITGGGRIVPIPGEPGEKIDSRILPDVLYLKRRYRLDITDGYAPTGHSPDGEHPIGLAIDAVPGKGGSWAEVGRLARWAEPRQNAPRPPFRWVGYNGDSMHGDPAHCSGGCPAHIHLSWQWGGGRGPPAGWVMALDLK